MKIITLYDGTIQSKTALKYGIIKAKERKGELVVLQVFQASLFMDYDAGPRAVEIARDEARRYLQDAEKIIHESGQGIPIRIVTREGEPEQELLRVAETEQADLVLISSRYKGIVRSSPCPVQIIPGTILVPVDSSNALTEELDVICREAGISGSSVLLMGIVPIHLYNIEEKNELDQIRKKTETMVRKMTHALREKGLEVANIIRSGYPDEEILKAADEYSVSLIMLPAGGKMPSELTKAAAFLIDEPQRIKNPISLMQPAEA
jgi:nucleotide-binding universal stress UspA family protein